MSHLILSTFLRGYGCHHPILSTTETEAQSGESPHGAVAGPAWRTTSFCSLLGASLLPRTRGKSICVPIPTLAATTAHPQRMTSDHIWGLKSQSCQGSSPACSLTAASTPGSPAQSPPPSGLSSWCSPHLNSFFLFYLTIFQSSAEDCLLHRASSPPLVFPEFLCL